MILADTSIWIEFLAGRGRRPTNLAMRKTLLI
jgi:predicted nucleic acid-binding protein